VVIGATSSSDIINGTSDTPNDATDDIDTVYAYDNELIPPHPPVTGMSMII
jgi:hypothetical protein